MELGLFLFYLISFAVGTTALVFFILIYAENKNRLIKYYTMVLGVEFFSNTANLIFLQNNIKDRLSFNILAGISSFFELLILGFLLLHIAKVKNKKIPLLFISVVLFFATLSIVLEDFSAFKSFHNILFIFNMLNYAIIIYYLYLAISALKIDKNSEINIILKVVIASFIFATPMAAVRELFFHDIPQLNHLEDSMVYFVLNIGGFILFYKKMSLKFSIIKETENNAVIEVVEESIKSENSSSEKLKLSDFALTQRELQITHLIMDGLSNQDIADQLFISIKTVKTHIYNVYQKLDLSNRTELIYKFKRGE